MKIIIVDNYDRDYIADTVIAEKVHSTYAQKICDFLNNESDSHSQEFFKVVTDNYELYKGALP